MNALTMVGEDCPSPHILKEENQENFIDIIMINMKEFIVKYLIWNYMNLCIKIIIVQ